MTFTPVDGTAQRAYDPDVPETFSVAWKAIIEDDRAFR
jgi:hypothetical protein